MKRTFVLILAAVGAVAVFGWLVHMVLVAAHLSEPAPTTVYGMTPRRLWATAVAVLALVAVVIGGWLSANPPVVWVTVTGRMGAIVAMRWRLIAAVNGGLNLAMAKGGPAPGNGVIAAAALGAGADRDGPCSL